MARLKTEQLKVEVRRDIEVLDAYESTHGSFPEMVREHYRDASDNIE